MSLSALPRTVLKQKLEMIISGLIGITGGNKVHTRSKVRFIFEKLTRVFGYDGIQNLVPVEHRVMLPKKPKVIRPNNRE